MGMIDISEKELQQREAIAEGTITLTPATIAAIRKKKIPKGDVLQVAETAAISAVKKTPELLVYCHQIPLTSVDVQFRADGSSITVAVGVKAIAQTGVEMDALTGVSLALLSIWDMVKYREKNRNGQYPITQISGIRLIKKTKGEHYGRAPSEPIRTA